MKVQVFLGIDVLVTGRELAAEAARRRFSKGEFKANVDALFQLTAQRKARRAMKRLGFHVSSCC